MRAFFCFLLIIAPGLFNNATGFFTTPLDSKRGKDFHEKIKYKKKVYGHQKNENKEKCLQKFRISREMCVERKSNGTNYMEIKK